MQQEESIPLIDSASTTSLTPSERITAAAAAAERRIREARLHSSLVEGAHTPFDENHDKRQHFRRLIDPGILRPNSRDVALEALQTLKTLAGNIMKYPDDLKYHKFKPTNERIKRCLIQPAGTLEYAVALGFQPQVENFQPFYVFNKRHLSDLRIGTAILQEALERELVKEERAKHAREAEKAASEAAIANTKQAFMDDRKSRALQERRERETRTAIEAAALNRSSLPPASPSLPVPSSTPGHTMGSEAGVDTPPHA